jgi:hypothetical protein
MMADNERGQATLPSAAPKEVAGRGVDALNPAIVPRLGRAQLSPIGENTAAEQIIAGAGRQQVSAVLRVGEGVTRRGKIQHVVPANNPVPSATSVVTDPRRPTSPRNGPTTSDVTVERVTDPARRHTRRSAREARERIRSGPFGALLDSPKVPTPKKRKAKKKVAKRKAKKKVTKRKAKKRAR